MTNSISLILGLLLLAFGRRLYWLIVGAIGFFAGLSLAERLFQDESSTVILVLALIAGVIGSLLAVLVQRVALGLAGFLVGGYLATNLLALVGMDTTAAYSWIAFILGGVIGAALVAALFYLAMTVLSALTGAFLVVDSIQLSSGIEMLIFIGLVIAGLVLQRSVFGSKG